MSAIRFQLIALSAFVPLALIGCSDSTPTPTTTTVGATTAPAAKPVATTTAEPVVRTIPADISYEDAEAVYRSGRYEDAARHFEVYAASHPKNAFGHYMLGLSAWKSGDHRTAEKAFDAALALDPSHVKSLLNSSRVLLERDRATEALERIERALEIDSVSSDGLRLLGRANVALGRTDDAIDAYRRAIVTDNGDVWAMNNLGLIYIEQGDAEQALAPLARAVELRPTAPVFQNNLGIALERTGQLQGARDAFTAALAADSTYGKAAASLARVNAQADTVSGDTVDLAALAQSFRMQVRVWQDNLMARDVVEEEVPAVDTTILVEKPADSTIIDSTVTEDR